GVGPAEHCPGDRGRLMALTEAQVVRYSRQILLAPVGGVGQERLLAAGVHVQGHGQALATAAAYLAAGGTRVEGRRAITDAQRGFLFTAVDVQESGQGSSGSSTASPRLDERGKARWSFALKQLNPDASSTDLRGMLAELPATFSGEAPW